ncbi:pygopus homolog 1 isoform X2 [Hoplias malabaricus]|uniref:pygopus homolog 1 isoform X2 n=1 Tax=Hoplias malabaricus TaxID=27720 RepID=UPI003461974F
MSSEQEKDSFSLKRNRGGDGGLESLGGPGLLLGSTDKKKRKNSTQTPSLPPLSEYAPPVNPNSDHLVASNPFDDNYNSPPPSLKPLNAASPYFGPSTFSGLGGYGPARMVPHIQNRMPSPYGSPFQIRNQAPHLFGQNPVGQIGMGFVRPPGFNYGHPDNPAFSNQLVFNSSGGVQGFRPGPGENLSQLAIRSVNQNQSCLGGLDGVGVCREGTGNVPQPVKRSPEISPGLSLPLGNFGQSNTAKKDTVESVNYKNQSVTSPRKQSQTSEEAGGQDSQVEPKGKTKGNVTTNFEGGVEKMNGIIHPGSDPLKKSPQPGGLTETPSERKRKACRSGAPLASNKASRRSNNPSSTSSEPVYPCGICLSEVKDDQEAILCEASCQKWFHRLCTGMTEMAYNLLTAEIDAVWGCDSCMEKNGVQLLKTRETPRELQQTVRDSPQCPE